MSLRQAMKKSQEESKRQAQLMNASKDIVVPPVKKTTSAVASIPITSMDDVFAKIKVGTKVSVLWDDGIIYEATVEAHHKTITANIQIIFTNDGCHSIVKMSNQSIKGYGIVGIVSDGSATKSTKRLHDEAASLEASSTSVFSKSSSKSQKKKKKKTTASTTQSTTTTTTTSIWPGSGSNWIPTHTNWGTRTENNFGCGKCRWRPKGCRGCIASAESYVAATPLMVRGMIQFPIPLLKDYNERKELLTTVLLPRFDIINGPQQCSNGYGIIVSSAGGRPFLQGECIIDSSVVYMQRPAAYGKAHLGEYDYVALGSSISASSGYFQLRELALGHCALSYYVNEARNGQMPNAEFSTVRTGGSFEPKFCLRALVDICPGEELLVHYNNSAA